MSILDNAIPLRRLDDATLIQKFVAGDTSLLANQNLRVEVVFGGSQLLSKREGVIASIKLDDKPPTALVRTNSPYQELVHHALEEANFLQLVHDPKQGFWNYEKRSIPVGYRLHCSEARFLWKEWWLRSRQPQLQAIDMGLLVMIRDQWYPIRDMASSNGMIYVKTLIKEIVIEVSGHLAWLGRNDGEVTVRNGASGIAASQRPYRRLPGMPVIRGTAHPSQNAFVAQQEIPRRNKVEDHGVFAEPVPVKPHGESGEPLSRVELKSVPMPQEAQPLDVEQRSPQGWQPSEVTQEPEVAQYVNQAPEAQQPDTKPAPSAEYQPASSQPAASAFRKATQNHLFSVGGDIPHGDDTTILESVSPAILRVALAEEETILEMGPITSYTTAPPATTPAIQEPAQPAAIAAEAEPEFEPETLPNILSESMVDFGAVLKFQDGRIHVTTVIGELVIEGEGLKFWLNRSTG